MGSFHTGDELEGLGDHSSKLFGVGNFDIGHFDGVDGDS